MREKVAAGTSEDGLGSEARAIVMAMVMVMVMVVVMVVVMVMVG